METGVGDTELNHSLPGVPSSLLGQTGKLMISIQWNENHDWGRRGVLAYIRGE